MMNRFSSFFLFVLVTAASGDNNINSLRGLSQCNDDNIGFANALNQVYNMTMACAAAIAEYPEMCNINQQAALQFCPVTCGVGCGATPYPPITKKIELDYGGFPRNFYIHIPRVVREKHELGEEVPAVIMFHGTGKDGLYLVNTTNSWLSKADDEGFVTVFPSALEFCYTAYGGPDILVESKWVTSDDDLYPFGEDFTLCTPEEFQSLDIDIQASLFTMDDNGLPLIPNDVVYMDNILDILLANTDDFSLNENEIFITGNSNGAFMTSRYAVERSTRINKAIWNAGGLRIDDVVAMEPKPAMVTLGNYDIYLANITGWPIPIPTDVDMLQNESLSESMFAPIMLAHGLDPEIYVYSEIIFGGKSAGEYLFETSTIGLNNQVRLLILSDQGHGYPNGPVIDDYWDFFINDQ